MGRFRAKIFFLLWLSSVGWAQAGLLTNRDHELYVPGEVLVKLKPGAIAGAEFKTLSAQGISAALVHTGLYKIKLASQTTVEAAVKQLQGDSSVLWAQPNYRYYVHCAEPTDSYYAYPLTINGTQQLSQGQPVTASWPLLKIKAPAAWALFVSCPPGDSSVTVAVLDTGISKNHPDLAGIHYAPGDNTAGANSHGVDYSSTDTDDDFGHGTFVTGIIAAQWGNSTAESCAPFSTVSGMAGLAPGITILPVKVLDDTGSGSTEGIIEGTDYAVAHGAKVLNFSLGGAFFDQAQADSLDNAIANDCVVVASTGNDGGSLDFPAKYPPVVAVGATDNNDQIAFYSNFGTGIDLVAPGGAATSGTFADDVAQDILSAMLHCPNQANSDDFLLGPDPNFGAAAGTSASAPYVTGTVALMRSMYPSLTNTQVVQRLLDNTDSLNGNKGWDSKTGYGRLNAYRALYSSGALTPTPSPEITHYMKTFNSPNPFYPQSDGSTNITLAISQPEAVELKIYDAIGSLVLLKDFSAGELNGNSYNPQFKSYYVSWDGKNGAGQDVKTGIYFYTIRVGGQVGRNKIALIQGTR